MNQNNVGKADKDQNTKPGQRHSVFNDRPLYSDDDQPSEKRDAKENGIPSYNSLSCSRQICC